MDGCHQRDVNIHIQNHVMISNSKELLWGLDCGEGMPRHHRHTDVKHQEASIILVVGHCKIIRQAHDLSASDVVAIPIEELLR